MPYIREEARQRLDVPIDRNKRPHTAGELNYEITYLLLNYLHDRGLSYDVLNDCIGACESAKLEFYRRAVVPFEEDAIKRNGDIY